MKIDSKIKKATRFLKSKAGFAVDTAIKVLTAVVLGALVLTGLYGVMTGIIAPQTKGRMEAMYHYEGGDSGSLNGSFEYGSGNTFNKYKVSQIYTPEVPYSNEGIAMMSAPVMPMGVTIASGKVVGHRMSIGTIFSLDFIAELDASYVPTGVMTINHYTNGSTTEVRRKTVINAKDAKKDENGNYIFPHCLPYKEMADTLVASFTVDGTEIFKQTYSVREYAEFIINDTTGKYDKEKGLMKTMLNYGAASQGYLKYGTTNLANKNLSAEDRVIKTQVSALDKYAFTMKDIVQGTVPGISYYASTLNMDSLFGIRHYFKVDPAYTKEDFKFELLDGFNAVELPVKEGKYGPCIEITPVNLKNLDNAYVVRVKNLKDEKNSTMTVKYSVNSYLWLGCKNQPERLSELVTSMADFSNAAYNYSLITE